MTPHTTQRSPEEISEREAPAALWREHVRVAEHSIAVIRALAVLSVVVLFTLTNLRTWGGHALGPALVLGAATIYALLAYRDHRRRRRVGAEPWPLWVSYAAAVLDGVLVLSWIALTGGIRSPYSPVMYVAVLSFALRFRPSEVMVTTAAYGAGYLGIAVWLGQLVGHGGEVAVHIVYLGLIGSLGAHISGQLRRRLAREWEGRRRAELLLRERGALVEDLTARAQGEREAHQRLRLLSEAGRVLTESLDYRETLDALSEVVVPHLADWYGVELLREDGEREQVVMAHRDPAKVQLAYKTLELYPPQGDEPTGPARVLRTGRPELVPAVSDEVLREIARDERHYELLRVLGLGSVMIVPLTIKERIIGVITMVASEQGRRYTRADLSFAEELARRASIAVENAILYKQAQEAIQARDDFLSIASHELRTPLSSLTLQVGMLERLARGPRSEERPLSTAAARVATIARQVERLASLVDNLLDVSRVVAGRLVLEREEVDLADVVDDVVERVREDLERAGCQLHREVQHGCVGTWDRLRLEQILHNLLTNAIKYGAGTPVEVRLHRADGRALLEVEDHGIGIDAEDQARIFQRFERAVSPRHFGGLGLGLWIVRQIVEAMGGEIHVLSAPGKGALFRVLLPREQPATDGAEHRPH